jgi:hypothetical protein
MTKIEFIRVAAEHGSDPDFSLHVDGQETAVSIQDSTAYGGGYTVNLYGDDETDGQWIQDFGTFSHLKAAKIEAVNAWQREGFPLMPAAWSAQ